MAAWRAVIGLALWVFAGSASGANSRLPVCLVTSNTVSPAAIERAQMVASQVLSTIKLRLQWRVTEAKSSDLCKGPIRIEYESAAAESFRPGSLAYTVLDGSSTVRIHVMADRVVRRVGTPELTGALLGHVMAHEIGHVLEGVAHHSATGVMKAHWDDHDITMMAMRPLPFASVDVEMIHAGVTIPGFAQSLFLTDGRR